MKYVEVQRKIAKPQPWIIVVGEFFSVFFPLHSFFFFFFVIVTPNPPFIIVLSLQALVQLLRTEGVQLGDKPVPPEDTIKLRPKRYGDQLVNFDDMPEWVSYW